MRIRYVAKTDVGMKRNHNEDYFSLLEEEQLFIVCDGMGGHASGEVASRMAAETVTEFFKYSRADQDATWPYKMDSTKSYAENRLAVGIKMANFKIFQSQATEAKYKGMGTTIVSIQVLGDSLLVGHVGDSRGYRLRGGTLEQITVDHSLLEEYKQAKKDITEEELRNFPHKNVITRALGMRENVQVDVQKIKIEPGDMYLLCSDGLSGMITDKGMEEIMKSSDNLEKVIHALLDKANENGGNDNITCVILKFEE
ncbi:Stp1/IreP family PP2C-type Ser/Thr phosphatase [Myxococcota bacterium]|nr:Stp1/IreP family PP2C-type Ser/Thr phosphatase [Myxococcota bacterium]MBU1381487.1 Stp1/IreP family PP2C-type Ser/Thr phosphatase [Myxococcota bacterium]MBU1497679.1 Stp1/IreP family PP2C-type Ser/Thr phosphatase [Myxococcota bacterium]